MVYALFYGSYADLQSLIYIIDDNVNQPLDQYLKSCPLLLSTP